MRVVIIVGFMVMNGVYLRGLLALLCAEL